MEEAAQADRVVLPVPLSRGKNLNCTAAALPLCGSFALLRPEQRLYAGGVKAADREAAAEFGLTLTDYLSREELAVRNGVPTAEGAVEAAMAATDVTLCGTPCLGHRLRAHRQAARPPRAGAGRELLTGQRRRLDDLAWIDAFGYRGLRPGTVSPDGSGASASSSTPCRTSCSQRSCCANCRASACCSSWPRSPASTVRRQEERAGSAGVSALGLPGKAAPETAARAIKLTLEKIWEEEA